MAAFGILSYGAHVPVKRIERRTILDAVGWAQPGLKGLAKGERSFAGWDEDAITLAVEASRTCLMASELVPERVCFASTTAPFLDRQNAAIVATALDLHEATGTNDAAGSQRAATAALIDLAGGKHTALLTAGEKRPTKSASTMEMLSGDAGAAVLLGTGEPVAEIVATGSLFADLVDHYRTPESETDYVLEERWFRDEGLSKLTPRAVAPVLATAGIGIEAVDHVIAGLPGQALGGAVAKAIGADKARLADQLHSTVGHSGAAHPLLMLVNLLETAEPDQWILLLGFGQGVDAILLRTTKALGHARCRGHLAGVIERGKREDNYTRFLAAGGRLDIDWGMRAERDSRTAQTVAYNKTRDIYGLVGGKCETCGTPQFPKSRRCVNPNCSELDTQTPYRFADLKATVKSFTEDWMAFTRDPPLVYGNISFDGGGNIFMEMSGFAPGEVAIGSPVQMAFRIKDIDRARGFHRYYWKAVPQQGGKDA